MQKFFAQIKALQPTYERLTDNLKKIEGLRPVDEERQKMIVSQAISFVKK